MSRRVKVSRDTPTATALTVPQLLEVKNLIQEEVALLTGKVHRQEDEIVTQNLYIHNISVILRDMAAAVLVAKYSSRSVKNTLEELIEQFENALSNTEHLVSTGDPNMGEYLDTYRQNPPMQVSSAEISETEYPDVTDPYFENDPVDNLSEF